MKSYDELRDGFRWDIPARFNIGVSCADRQPPHDPALTALAPDGSRRKVTFGELAALSNRFGNALRGLGVGPGDRVAIVLPQRLETAIAHLAVYKLGAIAVPMSVLFGPDALGHRLGDSGARAIVTGERSLETVAPLADELDVIVVDGDARAPHHAFWQLLESASDKLTPVDTEADEPALLVYTSGTTGPAKGALHAHRVLLGHVPGFHLSHDCFPQPGDRFWSPADWAWIGGLLNSLLLPWLHGRPVVGAVREGAFDPEWALALVVSEQVRNTFLPPTALKLMRSAGVRLEPGALRTLMSAGEALGAELLAWAGEHLGVTVNEMWGQTEANYIVGNSSRVWEIRPGSMGRSYPGHTVGVLDGNGLPVAPGEIGELGVLTPDPVVFLEYWRRPEQTRAKVPDRWLRTGDRARMDEDGYLWFEGRTDDVILSAGYRIGPFEVESALGSHPAVAEAAAVAAPDELRGSVVRAVVVLRGGERPSDELARALQDHVKERTAPYKYPRIVEFAAALPKTVSGKVRRAALRGD